MLENAPLLDADADEPEPRLNGHAQQPTMATGQASRALRRTMNHLSTFRTLYIIGAFAFVIDTSFMMGVAPTTRLIELGICRDYYRKAEPGVIGPGGNVAELLCKVDTVQSRLAEVNGYITMLGFLPGMNSCSIPLEADRPPGIFLAVPFGILADRYGRIIVCAAAIVGVSLGYFWLFAVLYFYETLPFNLLYAYPLFFCIGGGAPVITALILAIITDVAPKEIRWVLRWIQRF
jgi:hypothetical protein